MMCLSKKQFLEQKVPNGKQTVRVKVFMDRILFFTHMLMKAEKARSQFISYIYIYMEYICQEYSKKVILK